jgi:hypothetical protein
MSKQGQASTVYTMPEGSKKPRNTAGAAESDGQRAAPTMCRNCGQALRPGELLCTRCGVVFNNRLKTKLRDDPVISPPTCPSCEQIYRYGEPVCRVCGTILNNVKPHAQDDTDDFATDLTVELADAEYRPAVGRVQFTQTPIFLQIEGVRLVLPPVETIIIGRFSGTSVDAQPDIDLGPFGAHEKGVSRRHIRVKRKGTLVLVTDIGSANGTWLNGQRLLVNGERLLRHGDELQLSHLKLRITYAPLSA